MNEKYVIIVAGGKGLRMGGDIPKQFVEVSGKPILMRTIDAFKNADPNTNVILVLPLSHQDFWKELCAKHHFSTPHKIANGGETRFHSVKNGLSLVPNGTLVGVHDGVRPFASKATIDAAYAMANEHGTAVPVVDCVDSVRWVDGESNKSEDRSKIKLVQTPQVFQSTLLHQAYQQDFTPLFTDDASVVEAKGGVIHLTPGNRENIKITTPFDLVIAEVLAKSE